MDPVKKITNKDIQGGLVYDVAKETMHSGTQAKTPEEVVRNITKK